MLHDDTNDVYLYSIFKGTIYALAAVPPFSVVPSEGRFVSSSRSSSSESSRMALRMSALSMTGMFRGDSWIGALLTGSASLAGERARFRDWSEVLLRGPGRDWRRMGVPAEMFLGVGEI